MHLVLPRGEGRGQRIPLGQTGTEGVSVSPSIVVKLLLQTLGLLGVGLGLRLEEVHPALPRGEGYGQRVLLGHSGTETLSVSLSIVVKLLL